MIESPTGRLLEKVPRWDLMGIEGCGGGKVFLGCLCWFGDIWEYIGKIIRSGGARGAHKGGGTPYPQCAPSVLVAASCLLRLHLQVSWLSSSSRKIIANVSFYLDSVWYSFSAKLKNKKKQKLALGSRLIS